MTSGGPETLSKGFVEGCSRQRPLEKFLDGDGVFVEGLLSGTRQRPSAKKSSRHGVGTVGDFFAEGRPSQRNVFF
jgi:hypothetical protein